MIHTHTHTHTQLDLKMYPTKDSFNTDSISEGRHLLSSSGHSQSGKPRTLFRLERLLTRGERMVSGYQDEGKSSEASP